MNMVRARLVLVIVSLTQNAVQAQSNVPITGNPAPGSEEFESRVVQVIQEDHIRDAAIALVKDDRLVYARGFGWPMRPRKSRFSQPRPSASPASPSR